MKKASKLIEPTPSLPPQPSMLSRAAQVCIAHADRVTQEAMQQADAIRLRLGPDLLRAKNEEAALRQLNEEKRQEISTMLSLLETNGASALRIPFWQHNRLLGQLRDIGRVLGLGPKQLAKAREAAETLTGTEVDLAGREKWILREITSLIGAALTNGKPTRPYHEVLREELAGVEAGLAEYVARAEANPSPAVPVAPAPAGLPQEVRPTHARMQF